MLKNSIIYDRKKTNQEKIEKQTKRLSWDSAAILSYHQQLSKGTHVHSKITEIIYHSSTLTS